MPFLLKRDKLEEAGSLGPRVYAVEDDDARDEDGESEEQEPVRVLDETKMQLSSTSRVSLNNFRMLNKNARLPNFFITNIYIQNKSNMNPSAGR